MLFPNFVPLALDHLLQSCHLIFQVLILKSDGASVLSPALVPSPHLAHTRELHQLCHVLAFRLLLLICGCNSPFAGSCWSSLPWKRCQINLFDRLSHFSIDLILDS